MVLPENIASALGGAWYLLNQTYTYSNGTERPPEGLGINAVGIIIYHPLGFMSANMWSTDPGHIPSPYKEELNETDHALIGKHTLSYAGQLNVWPGSNETVGTLTHGPLLMATHPSWVIKNQTRNYVVSKGAYEGKDVLRLWLNQKEDDSAVDIFWTRASSTNMSMEKS